MKIYNTVYPWKVAELIKQGKTVYLLDRKYNEVYNVKSINAERFIEATSHDNADNRYDFWIEEVAEVIENEKEKAANE